MTVPIGYPTKASEATATRPPRTPPPAAEARPHPAIQPSNPQRVLNVAVAAVGLVLAAPVMAVVAVVIKLTSPGPVLYSQVRVGLDRRGDSPFPHNRRRVDNIGGRPFTIYKFRTMRTDAESAGGAVWATTDDPRVTRVGRFLRQYRLDELPQLWNVLRGDMNIVGPRPERPQIFRDLRDQIEHYPLRQQALPGITGLAQVSHHYDRSVDDVRTKVSYDLEYIRRQSLWGDLKIMLRTVPTMLFRRGGW